MLNKTKTPVILFITILLIALIVANGCLFRKKEISVETVFVGGIAHSLLYAPLYIAKSQGYFASEHLDVSYQTIENNKDLINSLHNNTSQIILAGSQLSILDNLEEETHNLIIFAQLVNKDPSFLLARQPIESFSWETLNKKIIIGGIPYSTPQLVLEHLLLKHNLQPYKKIDIVQNIPKEATVGAFKGGVGDFIHLLEPEASQLIKAGEAYFVAALGESLGHVAYTTLQTKTSFLNEKPEVIQKFTRALYQAQLWCIYHSPEEIAYELEQFFPDLEKNIILSVVSNYKSKDIWSDNPVIKQKALDVMQEILLSNGMIQEKVSFTTIVNNSFAQQAIEEIRIPKEYLRDSEKVKQ